MSGREIKGIMIKRFFIIISIIAISIASYTQQEMIQDTTESYINKDVRVDSLIKLHKKAMQAYLLKEDHNGIDGYRVLIFREVGNNASERIEWEKKKFDNRYPEVPSYKSYQEPWFRVVVGDFRTKLEAEEFLWKIKRRYGYRGAMVVKSKIKLAPLAY